MDSGNITSIPLNTTDIPQSFLNIENKDRSNLFTWRGQFSPQFVEVLLRRYAGFGYRVLDPFAGSGTVLYEAGLLRLEAIASEINPSAYRMACIYRFINKKNKTRFHVVTEFDDALKRFLSTKSIPRNESPADAEEGTKEVLLKLSHALSDPLTKLLFEALIIRLDLYQAGLTQEKLILAWNKLKALVLALPYSDTPIEMFNCDARTLPASLDSSIDLVITSPPYINVFNYHQQYRASAEVLGWDLLEVAKSEIGSNRKHRGNRFLTVTQYCLDLAQSMHRLASICRANSRIIFVVGRESRVLGIPFYNGHIVSLLGVQCIGFDLKMRQERVFKNKFGKLIYEDILHFINPTGVRNEALSEARNIARSALEAALRAANSREVLEAIQMALARVSEVEPSPIYCPDAAFNSNANGKQRVATVR